MQEATVAAHHLMGRVAGKLGEGVGDVDDGSVSLEHVTEDKGDRAVDGTEIDLRVRPSNDAKLRQSVAETIIERQDSPRPSLYQSRWERRDQGI